VDGDVPCFASVQQRWFLYAAGSLGREGGPNIAVYLIGKEV